MSGGAIITNSSVMSVGPRRVEALPRRTMGSFRRSEGFQTRGVGSSRFRTRVPGTPEASSHQSNTGRRNFCRIQLWRVGVDGRRSQGKNEDSQSAEQQHFTRRPRKAEPSSTPSYRNKPKQNCIFPVQPFHDMAAEYVAGMTAP